MALDLEIPWLAGASRSARWLVGVSGGVDSVAMLHQLVDAGFRKLVVCHLNHRLRGRASTEDARFVARLAAKLGLACEIGRAEVRRRLKDKSESLETAARNARHEFFAQCAKKHRCRRVLLAHHADDQAETVLWNLLRGSHGLKGMRKEQTLTVDGTELRIYRPMLDQRHSILVDWLKVRRLPWREDASNAEAVAVRNRLRNEVFPLLAEISGRDPIVPFIRATADFTGFEELENEALGRANLLDPQGRLHLPALRKLTPAMQRAALRKFLVDQNIPAIDRALLDRAIGLLDLARASSINLPGGGKLRRREGRLWVERPTL